MEVISEESQIINIETINLKDLMEAFNNAITYCVSITKNNEVMQENLANIVLAINELNKKYNLLITYIVTNKEKNNSEQIAQATQQAICKYLDDKLTKFEERFEVQFNTQNVFLFTMLCNKVN